MPNIQLPRHQNPDQLALIILIVIGASIHFGGQIITQRILSHPLTQILQRDPQPTAPQHNTNINIIRTQPGKAAAVATPAPTKPNQIFPAPKTANPTPTNNTTAPAIDYFQQLQTGPHLNLTAITHNGAIINGKFHTVGQPIDALAYPAPGEDSNNPGQLITPRLTRITQNSITITEPTTTQKPRQIHLTLN